jgi:sigma-B regulation protein RsbU (phosphoserine phosphatase)
MGAILIRRGKVDPLTKQQRDLLRTFADQAAIAIENVRLFNEINEKSIQLKEQSEELAQWNEKLEFRVAEQVAQLEQFAKLEHELKVASDIQKSMLPRTIPEIEGYDIYADLIPAKTVGGDFYEFIPLTDDSLAIAIGDVADKGVPAALFMAMVRSFLRAEARDGVSPTKVLEAVNDHLLELNDKGIFVTILLGILNSRTHQFTYTRAGHELPVLIDNKGSVKHLSRGKGQALGIFDTLTLDEQHINFSDKSMMVLYTDGITDAISRDNQMFGLQGLIHTVSEMPEQSVEAVCEKLLRAVTKHQSPLPQFDDMTVIAIRALRG